MNSTNDCPSVEMWQAALAQGLTTEADQACVRHAEKCPTCQHLLEQLVGKEQSHRLLVEAAAALDTPPVGGTEMWLASPSLIPFGTVTPHKFVDVPTPVPTVPGYEILQELGRGGMGVVYLARHVALNRQVALKMILGGAYASAHDLARFRTEAEAVAKFTHPHIVQIYDIGTLEGVPYCALELISGGSLDSKLQGQPQPPREAAALLVPVAQAVQAAHDQGILHRDLKPANILLQMPNAECRMKNESEKPSSFDIQHSTFGIPKLTDFGLAKRLAEDSGHTRTGDIVGTPSYMAPEQAEGKVRQLGPAVDIYALGAILYQMLTGRPPFQGVSPLDTVLQVMTAEPVPPRQLQPTVPRDLETICLKCLHKEPAKRYLTASAMAADLQNYLDGKPIAARPAGRWERTVKWCRRYPSVAALLAVALLSALGMAALAAWALTAEHAARQNALAARQESEQKEEQRRKAVEQAELARAVTQFLRFDVLLLADPAAQLEDRVSGGKFDAEVKLRDVVLRAGQVIDGKFPDQPIVEAELRWTLGHTLLTMSRPDQAVVHLERMRELCTKHLDPAHSLTLTNLHYLANCYDDLGRAADALKLRETMLARHRAKHGDAHQATLSALLHVANSYDSLGRRAEGLQLRRDAHARFQTVLGADHQTTLQCLSNVADSHMNLGQHEEAVRLQERALTRMRATLGPNHPGTLLAMQRLANYYEYLGRGEEALPLLEETRTRSKTTLGPDHLDTLGCLMGLSNCYAQLDQLAQAQAVTRELITALEERQRRHPNEKNLDVMLAGAFCNMANWLGQDNKPAESLPWYERAQKRLEQYLSQEPRDATARHYLRNVYFCRAQSFEQLRRYAEAEADWEEALARSPEHEKVDILRTRRQCKAKRSSPATPVR